jgi:hypothetical protein
MAGVKRRTPRPTTKESLQFGTNPKSADGRIATTTYPGGLTMLHLTYVPGEDEQSVFRRALALRGITTSQEVAQFFVFA